VLHFADIFDLLYNAVVFGLFCALGCAALIIRNLWMRW
jgi:hypothetical protein